ncbi:MAG: hypothetical protein AAGC43_09340 [Bacteroidota bacterium]
MGVDKNYSAIQKVKIGMVRSEVDSIMKSKPLETKSFKYDLFYYSYDSHFAASDDLRILYSKNDSTVVEVLFGD